MVILRHIGRSVKRRKIGEGIIVALFFATVALFFATVALFMATVDSAQCLQVPEAVASFDGVQWRRAHHGASDDDNFFPVT